MDKTVSPSITFELAGASITIPEATIAELWLERAGVGQLQPAFSAAIASTEPPRIGEIRVGATYMGIVRGENGARDYQLWDLGEADKRMPWAEAMKWAEGVGGGLPTRRDQAVMFGNRGEGQYKSEWYWSCEQYAGYESYAWMQNFNHGSQNDDHKSLAYLARAVRRKPIQ